MKNIKLAFIIGLVIGSIISGVFIANSVTYSPMGRCLDEKGELIGKNIQVNINELFRLVRNRETGIQVKVGSFTCPAGVGNYSVTGLEFRPRHIEFKSSKDSATHAVMGLGQMDYNGNQDTQALIGYDNAQYVNVDTASCISLITDVGGDVLRASYVSMDSDGFTINFATIDATYTIFWKAIK